MKLVYLTVFLFVLSFTSLFPVSALSIVVHVPEKYTEVQAGERFYFEIEVKYPENPSRKDLSLEYQIIDKENNLIGQSKVLKAIETQASFIDFIVIPESAETGLHFIKISISDYEGLNEEVGASFNVIGNVFDQIRLYFFILLGAVLFVGLLTIIQIILIRRKNVRK